MSFIGDRLAGGRRIRTLNIMDDPTRQWLAVEVDSSLFGHRVCRVLDGLVSGHGCPKRLLTGNGPRFYQQDAGSQGLRGLRWAALHPAWQAGPEHLH